MRNEKGFTLLELIIVMVLVAIILALSTAFFANSLPSSKFNAAVRELVATIRHARSLAQTDGENQIVTIDLNQKTFGIQGRRAKALPPDVSIKVVDEIAGDITEGKHQLIFHAIGGAEGGTIMLWNNKRSATISLDPVVGTVATKSQAPRFGY